MGSYERRLAAHAAVAPEKASGFHVSHSALPTTPGSVIRSRHPVDLMHDNGIRVAVGNNEFLRPSDGKRYGAGIYWTFDVLFDAGAS